MTEDFINKYLLDDVKDPKYTTNPAKSIEHPTIQKALDAIVSLRQDKLNYIRGHSNKADFQKTSLWQIRKSATGAALDMSPQSLFNRASYSEKLSERLHLINEELKDLVEKKFSANTRGLQAQKKTDLIETVQQLRKRVQELEAKEVTDVVASAIDKLSPDVRRKLNL